MAERAFIELIENLKNGKDFHSLKNIKQTAYITDTKLVNAVDKDIILPSNKSCNFSKPNFAKHFMMIEEQTTKMNVTRIIEPNEKQSVIVNPPFPPANENETDFTFDLPYTYEPHPRYLKKEPIPAFEMIKNSITIHRGCFGSCSFCAIRAHQGKFISSRSEKSILQEIQNLSKREYFKGHVTDLGGPSANMYKMSGIDKKICANCKRVSCIYPSICKNLNFDHKPLIDLYTKATKITNIKKISIGSGIRYDILVHKNKQIDEKYSLSKYASLLINKHVSGRLKVAPEHYDDNVLKLMKKPSFTYFRAFNKLFNEINFKNNTI